MKDHAGTIVQHKARSSGKPSKVNDRDGNPIEISAVVVWKVVNTAEALFEVDEERRAAMVSNLLVVLCSGGHTQPVVNTGSLYS
jgi:regulator of protease activity HflC (stomatin/prohibitin superfamily)